MTTVKNLYNRIDEWLLGLSRRRYAVFLGASTAIGVLIANLFLNADFPVLSALTMGLVMFGLECVFGLLQPTED